MLLPLDGPAKQFALNPTSTVVVEVKDTTVLSERKVVTIMLTDGKIYVFFGDGTNTPSANDVQTKGFPHQKGALRSYEASDTQPLWIIADTGTVNVRVAERA